jgi:hypothetical protein
MTADLLTLQVELPVGDGDAGDLAERVGSLSAELLELDIDDVAPATEGEAPEGAKGLELVALGALVVKLGRSAKVLHQVVDAIRDWAGRNDSRTVKVALDGDVLEITGASAGDVKTVVDAWVLRHSEP